MHRVYQMPGKRFLHTTNDISSKPKYITFNLWNKEQGKTQSYNEFLSTRYLDTKIEKKSQELF